MSALIPPWCSHHAAKTWTPTNDREGVTWMRGPCGSPFFVTLHLARPPLPAIEPPGFLSPMEGTEPDDHLRRRFPNGMQYQAAWTGGIVVESCPQQGLGSCRDLSSSTEVWTRVLPWVALGSMHASILLKDQDGIFPPCSPCLFFYSNEIRELYQ